MGPIERNYLRTIKWSGTPIAIAGFHGGGFDLQAFTISSWIKPAATMGAGAHGNSGDIVRFAVARHHVVKHVAFDLITGSDSSCLIRFHLTRRGEINHDGEFQIVGGRAGTDRADAKKWIKGRFVTKKKVRGHVHAHVRGCGSAIAPFKAHLAHSG